MNKDKCYHNVLDILPKNDKRVEETSGVLYMALSWRVRI